MNMQKINPENPEPAKNLHRATNTAGGLPPNPSTQNLHQGARLVCEPRTRLFNKHQRNQNWNELLELYKRNAL